MKKIIFAVSFMVVSGFLFGSAVPDAEAITADEIRIMIQQLQAQIQALQQQLAQVEEKPTAWCYTFNANLRVGDSGEAVRALQTALEKEGFYQRTITGNFDEYTASAIVGFQEKYRSETLSPWGLVRGTGFLGATTRAKLNALYGCDIVRVPVEVPVEPEKPAAVQQPSITITSPASGQQIESGTTYIVRWDARWVEMGQDIYVYQRIAGGSYIYLAKLGYNAASYSWKAPVVPLGGDSFDIWVGVWGDSRWLSSNSVNVRVVPTAVTVTPSITYVSPTSGAANDTITIYGRNLINTDPSGNINPSGIYIEFLRNGVQTGTINGPIYTQADGLSLKFQLSGIFVANSQVETYQIRAVNANGKSNVVDFTILGSTTPSITVISPNGGEQWTAGQNYSIKVNFQNFTYTKADIILMGYDTNGNAIFTKDDSYSTALVIARDVNIVSSLINYWTIPADLENKFLSSPAKYKIKVISGPSALPVYHDYSDNYFSITAADKTSYKTEWDGGRLTTTLLRSDDGGKNWKEIMSQYKGGIAYVTNSKNLKIIYAGDTGGNQMADFLNIDLVKSTNGGDSWTDIFAGVISTDCSGGICSQKIEGTEESLAGIDNIWLDSSNSDIVKVTVKTFTNEKFTFKSINSGLTWARETTTPSITLLSPNEAETWEIDKTYTITWKHNLAGNFEAWIDLLKGGAYYGSIAGGDIRIQNAQNLSSYSWQVGQMKGGVGDGNDYQVRITYNDKNAGVMLTDTSDRYFNIVSTTPVSDLSIKNVVKADFHAYGFNLTVCMAGPKSINDLKKENPKITHYPVYYYVYDVYGNKHQGDIGVSGTPENLKNGECVAYGGTIQTSEQSYFNQTGKVEFVANPQNIISETNEKNNTFLFISPTPSLTVLSPNGGERWQAGETRRVSWYSTGVKYVRIYIYDDTTIGSGSTNYIYDGVLFAATGYYDWTINQNQLPGGSSLPRQYKIRADGLNETAAGATVLTSDHSDGYFTIASE
jgi:peptidoglycan hydrolase-like protein with peptidoglycan-binding domain